MHDVKKVPFRMYFVSQSPRPFLFCSLESKSYKDKPTRIVNILYYFKDIKQNQESGDSHFDLRKGRLDLFAMRSMTRRLCFETHRLQNANTVFHERQV